MPSSEIATAERQALPPVLLRASRKVSLVHRWLGTVLCAFFTLWFATGFVMIYVPFPALSDAARINASPRVDLAALRVTPAEALAAAGAPAAASLRLVEVLGQPRYIVSALEGPLRAVSGVQPLVLPWIQPAEAASIGGEFGKAPVEHVDGPFEHDQWVVHQRFDSARPFFRVDLAGAPGTQLYVSARTGEVLQRTTRFERGWNWVGAVVHWIYPTVLRKSFKAWDQTVWWLSLVGVVTALAGVFLGLVRTVNLRRKRRPGLSPFRGWMHWHHVLGLCAGMLVLTWIVSGWLSMDHGRFFSLEVPDAGVPERLRGESIAAAVAPLALDAVRAAGPAQEIEFTAIAGRTLLVQRRAGADSALLVQGEEGAAARTALLPDAQLLAAVAAAYAPLPALGIAPIGDDDAYGRLRGNELPASARRVTLGDPGETWIHIDAATGQLIAVMDRSRRIYRWLFEGLHTFDIPLLNRAGPLWQVLMLAGLAGGLAFSATALVLGTRRLRRSLPKVPPVTRLDQESS